MGMARGPQQQHRAFLLRLWQAGNGDTPEWRFSIEDVRTHERHGFADLASVVAFLEEQIRSNDHPCSHPDAGEDG